MASTSLDLSQIKTDALSAASTFRTLIGLGNVDNTSDVNKPISTATQTALDLKANSSALASYLPLTGGTLTGGLSGTTGTFSGTVTIPTITGSSNLIYVAQNQTFSWDFDTSNTNPALRFTWGGAATTLWGSSGAVNVSIQGVNGFRVAPGQTNIASTLGLGSVSSPALFLRSDSSGTLDIRNSTNAQRFNLYGTYTDASNYRRLYLSSTTAGAFTLGVQGLGTGASGNTLAISSNTLTNTGTATFSNTGYPNGAVTIKQSDGSNVLQGTVSQGIEFKSGWSGAVTGGIGLNNDDSLQIRHNSNGTILIASTVVLKPTPGQAAKIQSAGGLAVRNNDDNGDAPITAAAGAFSGNLSTSGRLVASGGFGVMGIGTAGHQLEFPSITGFLNLSMGTRGTGFSDRCQLHFQVAHNMLGQGFAATSEGFYVGAGAIIGFSSSDPKIDAPDLMAVRDAANTWAQRNGTNSQTFRLYNAFTDASNYIRQSLSFTTYSSTVYAQHVAEGLGTGAVNIPMVISPRGTGAFILGPMPDGTATGGNARGANAVDLQTSRASASQVASGGGSFAAGTNNEASGTNSIAIGTSCRAYGSVSQFQLAMGRECVATGWTGIAIGASCTSEGNEACIAMGYFSRNNSGSGYGSIAIGRGAITNAHGVLASGTSSLADRFSMHSHSSGSFSTTGDAQKVLFVARNKTTNTTPTVLFLDGSSTRLTIPSGKMFLFEAKIIGVRSDGLQRASYIRKGTIINVAGTTSLVGVIEAVGTDFEDNPALDMTITADDTNDALAITVTGITGETWRWVAVVEGVEVAYGT